MKFIQQFNLYLNMFIPYIWQIQVCRQSVFQCGAPVGGSIMVDQPELSHKRAYTRIGLYRGNIVAIKLLHKRSIDITRNIRKELKQVICIYYLIYTCITLCNNCQIKFAELSHICTQFSPCYLIYKVTMFSAEF